MRKLLIIGAATAAFTVSAADWYVAPNGTGGGSSSSDRGNVMDVLYNGQVASGDTIHFAAGTYNLDKNKSPYQAYGSGVYLVPSVSGVTFVGESGNPEDVRLVGTSTTDGMRIFYFSSGGHVIRDLTVSGGYTDYQGAGICMADGFIGNPEAAFCASNCVVENCSACYTGANFGGLWLGCVIRNNEVRHNMGTPRIEDDREWHLKVEGSGGGVFHAVLHDCVITNNVAGFCGGGIAGGRGNGLSDGAVCVTKAYNCLIGWNRATYGGGAGAAPIYGTRDYCQLFDCTLVGNTGAYTDPGDGGGLGGGAYQCVVSNCVVTGNSATRPGGYTTTFVAYGHDYGNGTGGGIMDCEVVDSVIEGNATYGGGGGAANSTLTRCHVTSNVVSWNAFPFGFGGGTYACSLVKDCVLDNNRGGYGGGAFNGNLENCVVSNNQTTAYDGGGAYNANTRNCLVTGNFAHRYYALCKGSHYGTLVYGNSNGKIDVLAASGIGADAGEPEAVAVNCTVWYNDNSSAQVSRTYMTNCIVNSVEYIPSAVNSFWRVGTVENQTGCISGEGLDPIFAGVDISLHPSLVANVAPEAYAIKSKSSCRDKGMTFAWQIGTTDLLGNPRVKNGIVDLGALEFDGDLGSTIFIR